jgi:non-ribosomal peptide synthetase component F
MSAIFDAFQITAAQQSHAPALADDVHHYTYAQALQAVQHLATFIDVPEHGAVLIAGAKQVGTVLWQLACSKAEQVFVPCDAAMPRPRMMEMIRRIQPRWIVDDPHQDHAAQGYVEVRQELGYRIWVSDSFKEYDLEVSHVVFSSGSTGEPKAIFLRAEPVVEVVQYQAKQLKVGQGSQVAWLLSPAFDASLSDIYVALLSGAALHVYTSTLRQLKQLTQFLVNREITHVDIPPSLLPLLNPHQLPALQGVVFGGELAQEACIQTWRQAGKRMFNAYGPTEATICTHFKEVDADWQPTNVGLPVPGISCGLDLGGDLSSMYPGLTGELLLAGNHLALGYDNFGLTSAKFVYAACARYYRTGDLVRVAANGELHFLGRVDRQLKVRGVLVCPEEVESVARRAGCLAAVLHVEGDRLVLHYTGPVTEATLRQALAQNLLTAACPHRYQHHDELQTSLTGKVRA